MLGVHFERSEQGYFFHQQRYIQNVLERVNMEKCNPVCTPFDVNVKLEKDDKVSKSADQTLYMSMVGNLIYLSCMTRPDITQAVSRVAKT